MRHWDWPEWRAGLVMLAAFVLVVGLGGVIVAWSGVYNVAASRGHFAITNLFLELGMRQSVETHSASVGRPPPLDEPGRIKLGASVYQGGCAMCHGTPDGKPGPIFQTMLPAPPDLREAVARWSPEELFWIVKHGIKYTAMPAWGSQGRDDEVWSVVAFLRKLPELDADRYRTLAHGKAVTRDAEPARIARIGTGASAVAVCARCHGDESGPPESDYVPKLAGQSAAYLAASLRHYAEHTRESGVMEPVAAELSQAEIAALAAYYAGLPPQAHRPASPPETARIERGSRIVAEGVPAEGVPACATCHLGGALPAYPKLVGQPAAYIEQQLLIWQKGLRAQTAEGRIMAPIARRMTTEQIKDVATYFASLGIAPKEARQQ